MCLIAGDEVLLNKEKVTINLVIEHHNKNKNQMRLCDDSRNSISALIGKLYHVEHFVRAYSPL